jgi:hypothetical protein
LAGIVTALAGVAATAAITRKVVLQVESPSDVVGFFEMDAKPNSDLCSKKQENCLDTQCCAVTGYTCFQRNSSYAGCMKTCRASADSTCEAVAPRTEPVAEWPGLSLYCFSVYTQETGSTKPSHELELLTEQLKRSASIFSCSGWAVYSDAQVELGAGSGVTTTKVLDRQNDFHSVKRPKVGGWMNTGMFVQVWKQIAADGVWSHHNWIVKVDPDAVFFPHRLLGMLRHQPVPAKGIYLENCKYVDYGYFGNLEVFSHKAFAVLLQNLDSCYQKLDWKTGIKGGKWGPMGEDLFAQRCMDDNGVLHTEAFGIAADGACEADRPQNQKKNKKYKPDCVGSTAATLHPFKKPAEWVKCWEEAQVQKASS